MENLAAQEDDDKQWQVTQRNGHTGYLEQLPLDGRYYTENIRLHFVNGSVIWQSLQLTTNYWLISNSTT